jgi:membrane-associated protein
MPIRTMSPETIVNTVLGFVVAYREISYIIIFVGSYLDAIIGINFIVRGEFFFLAGAILAGTGTLSLPLVVLVTFGGSILGDSTSYWIGREFGAGLFKERRFLFNPANLERGRKFLERFGARAVFLARLLGPVTWVTPFFAGVYRTPYRQFLLYDVLGVCVGVGQFIVVGYLFGNNYQSVLTVIRHYTMEVIVAVLAVALVYHVAKAFLAGSVNSDDES